MLSSKYWPVAVIRYWCLTMRVTWFFVSAYHSFFSITYANKHSEKNKEYHNISSQTGVNPTKKYCGFINAPLLPPLKEMISERWLVFLCGYFVHKSCEESATPWNLSHPKRNIRFKPNPEHFPVNNWKPI